MLKIIRLSNKLVFSKNNSNKSVLSRNNNSRLAYKKNNNNSKFNKFDIDRNDVKYAKKSEKLSKLKKSKNKKISKSQNLAKLEKKLLKNRNLTNFSVIEVKLKFLTSNAKTTFNCL